MTVLYFIVKAGSIKTNKKPRRIVDIYLIKNHAFLLYGIKDIVILPYQMFAALVYVKKTVRHVIRGFTEPSGGVAPLNVSA